MTLKKRILLVDDHTILRHGLRLLISSHGEFEIAGEAGNGFEAVKMALHLQPDLVLLDLSMPVMNGLDVIKEIKTNRPGIKILILTVHDNQEFIMAALNAGADGYVLKDTGQDELIMAIKDVMQGRGFIAPGISEKITRRDVNGAEKNIQGTIFETLTNRERQITKLIAEGYKTKQIANLLCISVKTADKHRENIMKKLDVHGVSALTSYAIEQGIVEVSTIPSE